MQRAWAILLVIICIVLVAGLAWVTGRPATLSSGDVDREVDSVSSLLAEGSMLAAIVERGDGYDRATGVRAAELADALDTTASTLDRSQLPPSRRGDARHAISAAQDGSGALARLTVDPGDRGVAAGVGNDLDAAAQDVTS